MAINKFDKFVTSDYVSQYVPFPMQEVMGMAQYMQQDFDQKEAQKELMLNQLRSQKVLTKDVADRDVFYKQTNEEINALLDKFGGNIRDKNAWKELKQKMTDVTFDPKVSAWSANYNAYQELEKQKSELIKQGKYFEANNLQNMMQWKGFEKTVGPDGKMNYLNFSEITPMIDVRGEVEKRIDAKKSSGEIREDGTGMYITEHGKEGVTYDEIYNSVYNDLMNENTPVGQQMRMNAEYNMYNQDRENYFTNAYKQGDYQYLKDTETFKQLGNTFNELSTQYKTIETTGVNPYTGKKLSDEDKTTLLSSIKDKQEEYQTYLNNPQSYFMQKEIKDVAASLGFEYSFMKTKDSTKLNPTWISLLEHQRNVQKDAMEMSALTAMSSLPNESYTNPFSSANKELKITGDTSSWWEGLNPFSRSSQGSMLKTLGLDGAMNNIISWVEQSAQDYKNGNINPLTRIGYELSNYVKNEESWSKNHGNFMNGLNGVLSDYTILQLLPGEIYKDMVDLQKSIKDHEDMQETKKNQVIANLDSKMEGQSIYIPGYEKPFLWKDLTQKQKENAWDTYLKNVETVRDVSYMPTNGNMIKAIENGSIPILQGVLGGKLIVDGDISGTTWNDLADDGYGKEKPSLAGFDVTPNGILWNFTVYQKDKKDPKTVKQTMPNNMQNFFTPLVNAKREQLNPTGTSLGDTQNDSHLPLISVDGKQPFGQGMFITSPRVIPGSQGEVLIDLYTADKNGKKKDYTGESLTMDQLQTILFNSDQFKSYLNTANYSFNQNSEADIDIVD